MEYRYTARQQGRMDALVAAAMSWYSQLPANTEGGHMEFSQGQHARLVSPLGGAEVVVDRREAATSGTVYRVRPVPGSRAFLVSANALVPLDVVWQPGDVVVVQYAPVVGAHYTYVRGKETWPTDEGRKPKTDEQMNALYAQGKVTPKLQAGGKPFDPARLPGAPKLAQGGIVSAPGTPRAGSFVFYNDGQIT